MSNGKGEVVLERVAGTRPNQEIVIPNLKYWQAQSTTVFACGKRTLKTIPGKVMSSNTKETNGFLITITFSGKATPNPAD